MQIGSFRLHEKVRAIACADIQKEVTPLERKVALRSKKREKMGRL
jgi:hypothetical protein